MFAYLQTASGRRMIGAISSTVAEVEQIVVMFSLQTQKRNHISQMTMRQSWSADFASWHDDHLPVSTITGMSAVNLSYSLSPIMNKHDVPVAPAGASIPQPWWCKLPPPSRYDCPFVNKDSNPDSWSKRWWSGNGISWTIICKSFAPRSRQITMPVPHHSVFTGRMPFLLPNQQCQS